MNDIVTIKNFYGRVIGTIETDKSTGNKTVKNFYGRVVGFYDARTNVTKNFYGRVVAHGDASSMLLSEEKK